MKMTYCRGCHSEDLNTVHDFGLQPLAGSYPTVPNSAKAEEKYPLDLTQCRACGLLQVVNLPPIERVFHADYRYSSSTIPALVRHFEEYAAWLAAYLEPGAQVLEFGCNDGVLLLLLQRRGFVCKGIDASDNVASLARAKGLDVSTGFLTVDFVEEKGYTGQFSLVTCSNVFAHINDLRDTLKAVRNLLLVGGFFAVEVHDGDLLCREGQFDTVYHEHLTYFTEATLRDLLEREGFHFVACDKTPMHGGGLRLIARFSGELQRNAAPTATVAILDDFIGPSITRCRAELESLYFEHGPLSAYGAAGRSQMFINMTQSAAWFSRMYDDSSFRQGRYIAATDIPITPYANETGNCMVILAWNYAPDIVKKINGNYGDIVTLLPEFRRY